MKINIKVRYTQKKMVDKYEPMEAMAEISIKNIEVKELSEKAYLWTKAWITVRNEVEKQLLAGGVKKTNMGVI